MASWAGAPVPGTWQRTSQKLMGGVGHGSWRSQDTEVTPWPGAALPTGGALVWLRAMSTCVLHSGHNSGFCRGEVLPLGRVCPAVPGCPRLVLFSDLCPLTPRPPSRTLLRRGLGF